MEIHFHNNGKVAARWQVAGGNTFLCNEKGCRRNVLVSAKCAADGMLPSWESLLSQVLQKALPVFCLRNVPILLSGNIFPHKNVDIPEPFLFLLTPSSAPPENIRQFKSSQALERSGDGICKR